MRLRFEGGGGGAYFREDLFSVPLTLHLPHTHTFVLKTSLFISAMQRRVKRAHTCTGQPPEANALCKDTSESLLDNKDDVKSEVDRASTERDFLSYTDEQTEVGTSA